MKDQSKNIHKFPLHKFIQYRLHVGGFQSVWNPKMKPFLSGLRNHFGIFDLCLTQVSIRHTLKLFSKIIVSRKKILFVGSPMGLEKPFSLLCQQYGHYHLFDYANGFFTNFTGQSSKYSQLSLLENKPCLIIFFDLLGHEKIKKDLLRLNLPILAFATTSDDVAGIDFVIPANISSRSGGLFVYNLFYHLFLLGKTK